MRLSECSSGRQFNHHGEFSDVSDLVPTGVCCVRSPIHLIVFPIFQISLQSEMTSLVESARARREIACEETGGFRNSSNQTMANVNGMVLACYHTSTSDRIFHSISTTIHPRSQRHHDLTVN